MIDFISQEELMKLNERDRRLTLAKYAQEIGYGGISKVSKRYHVSRNTIRRGIADLKSGEDLSQRIRRPGAGRRPLEESFPTLTEDVLAIAEKESLPGQDENSRILTTSCRKIARELSDKYQHSFSPTSINRILIDNGFVCPRKKPE